MLFVSLTGWNIFKLTSIAMLSSLVLAFFLVTVSAGVAPGDEEAALCKHLRATGAAPTPAYSTNMRVLMDSWNYRNLLPLRTGAVWDQVDNDMNNGLGFTTDVSFILSILNCSYAYGHALYVYSGFSSPTLHANNLSKCVDSVLVHRTTGWSHSSSTGQWMEQGYFKSAWW